MLNPIYLFGGSPRVNLPAPMQSEAALLTHLGMSSAELKKIWWYRGGMYASFSVSKKGGKKRQILAPNYRLKMIQRKVADLLSLIYSPRKSVHGFVSDRSVKSNAESHVKSRYVVNIDLRGFFPAITESRIAHLFRAMRVDPRVSDIIARICCVGGQLPQGSPSSPVISNMICFRMDKELQSLAKEFRCIYTRYADDITFSSFQPPSGLFESGLPSPGKFNPDLLCRKIRATFTHNGFEVNPDKTHYADRNSRRVVTGVRVNQFLNVDRRYVRNIRATLFRVERDGAAKVQAALLSEYGRKANIALHLHGKISWIGHIKGQSDPVFRSLALRFNKVFPGSEVKVRPTDSEIQDRSVWIVEHEHGDWFQGTAFFLKSVGLVTAWHCVSDAEKFEVEIFHSAKPANRFKATVKKYCDARDLAILTCSIPETEYFEMIPLEGALADGDQVLALGYPSYGVGDKLNIRPGTVTSLPVKHAVQMIETSQKLTQGMSGGPVVNSAGQVCGVIHKGGPGEGRDFAIHISALNEWLATP